jgi:hypothetical protein
MQYLPPISALLSSQYAQQLSQMVAAEKKVAIHLGKQVQTFELSTSTLYKDLLEYATDHWNVDKNLYELRNVDGDIVVGVCNKKELFLVPKKDATARAILSHEPESNSEKPSDGRASPLAAVADLAHSELESLEKSESSDV